MKSTAIASVSVVLALTAGCTSGGDAVSSEARTTLPETTIQQTTTSTITPILLVSGNEPLQAGTYTLSFADNAAHEFPRATLTVPEGWANLDGWLISKSQQTPRWMAVSFWDVDSVYAHPCDWLQPTIEVGRSVDELVAVLVDRPLRNATSPTDVNVDGYSGKELSWSFPTISISTTAISPKDSAPFESWTALGWSSDRLQRGPGQVDRLLILDIDGERLVIDVMNMPGATPEDLAELQAVVDSIRFED